MFYSLICFALLIFLGFYFFNVILCKWNMSMVFYLSRFQGIRQPMRSLCESLDGFPVQCEFPAVSIFLLTHCTVRLHTLNLTQAKGTGSPRYAMQAHVFSSREYWMDVK